MSGDQLELFATDRRPPPKERAGLAKEIGPGAERLLGEMVKRGLPERALHRAASLCLLLDAEPARDDG
jgi:hypothetical protein